MRNINMKNIFLLMGLLSVCCCTLVAQAAQAPHAPGRLLVKLHSDAHIKYNVMHEKDSVSSLNVLRYLNESKRVNVRPLLRDLSVARALTAHGLDRIMLVTGLPADRDMEALAWQLQQDFGDEIEYAEPDYIGYGSAVPNDPKYTQQWGPAKIRMSLAWDITTGSSDIVIGHLDSGVASEHPDFAGALLDGYDFVNEDSDPGDDHGHGSNTGGIIVARMNDGVGIAGICPECSLLPLKVLDDDNTGYYSWWVKAIEYGISHGVDVFNMSLGGVAESASLQDAIKAAHDAGIVIVACMMNANGDTPYYPAAYDETIAVGATDSGNDRAVAPNWGSNYGSHIDVVAPGAGILGPAKDGSGFEQWSGTSQAAPHVAGLAGLMLSLRSDLSTGTVRNILRSTATDRIGDAGEDTPGWDRYFGYGQIDAPEALQQVQQVPQPDGDVVVDGDISDTADNGEIVTPADDSGCNGGTGWMLGALLMAALVLRRTKQRAEFHA